MFHIPILRYGESYKSLDVAVARHYRTREPFVEVSQANAGLIRRDLRDQKTAREELASLSTSELVDICKRAAENFLNASLPLGDDTQSPDDYVRYVSATTGMPHVLARRNMQKLHGALTEAGQVIDGLTRNIDWKILDRGFGDIDGKPVSFYPRTESLGVVLPSNSPGVHSLWVPAIPLKIPLVLKPGSAEPWTPYRIIQAFIEAGAPPAAFSFYPTDHAGAGEILSRCQRGIMFGDASSVGVWANDPRIELHGPGYSKILIGPDCADDWQQYLDLMVRSIAENGGRSCINASGIWVTKHAKEIGEALAQRLAAIEPRAEDDPEAQIAPFADANVATRVSQLIDQGLNEEGARDVTASYRPERLVERDGCKYLLPTVIMCDSAEHGLANREYMFPFATVVECPQDQMIAAMGQTLVCSAITNDQSFRRQLVDAVNIDRLNLGPVPTIQLNWLQPHEGNIVDFLFRARAFQVA